ncbi:MAG TPA: hypothetical protein VEK78_03155 [Gemmatimonadales bacterium]|nr:hypothetical protein [Gemmatimonadales bacterium]HYT82435.1 hypothetical protein [Gemmatimonadales bacterium]
MAYGTELTERFEAMDINEKAQRMQAFMMKDPQAAMKMMQAEHAAGSAITSSIEGAAADGRHGHARRRVPLCRNAGRRP